MSGPRNTVRLILAEVLWSECLNDEYILKDIFIDRLLESIRNSMLSYMGSKEKGSIYDLAGPAMPLANPQIGPQNTSAPFNIEKMEYITLEHWLLRYLYKYSCVEHVLIGGAVQREEVISRSPLCSMLIWCPHQQQLQGKFHPVFASEFTEVYWQCTFLPLLPKSQLSLHKMPRCLYSSLQQRSMETRITYHRYRVGFHDPTTSLTVPLQRKVMSNLHKTRRDLYILVTNHSLHQKAGHRTGKIQTRLRHKFTKNVKAKGIETVIFAPLDRYQDGFVLYVTRRDLDIISIRKGVAFQSYCRIQKNIDSTKEAVEIPEGTV